MESSVLAHHKDCTAHDPTNENSSYQLVLANNQNISSVGRELDYKTQRWWVQIQLQSKLPVEEIPVVIHPDDFYFN